MEKANPLYSIRIPLHDRLLEAGVDAGVLGYFSSIEVIASGRSTVRTARGNA